MTYDVALGPDESGESVLAHRPDCQHVRFQADVLRLPVVTMLGCKEPLPDELRRHVCLDNPQEEATP